MNLVNSKTHPKTRKESALAAYALGAVMGIAIAFAFFISI